MTRYLLTSLISISVLLIGCRKDTSVPHVENDGEWLSLNIGDKKVLSYALSTQFPPDTLPSYYQRSGFIHPLMTPDGVVLTDGFPEGHTHQHGLFFALVNTSYQGRKVDFWNQHQGTGTVRHHELMETYETSEVAGFRAMLQHLVLPDTSVVFEEFWDVCVSQKYEEFLVEFKSTLIAVDTVLVNEYHYGGLGFRGPSEWNDLSFDQPGDVNYIGVMGKGGFLTSSGKTRMNGNHSHERWVSFHGMVGNDSAGVIVFSHPSNYRSEQAVRLHPVMPYFSFSPMVDGAFELLPGDTLRSRYLIVAHDGPADNGHIESLWQEWIQDTGTSLLNCQDNSP